MTVATMTLEDVRINVGDRATEKDEKLFEYARDKNGQVYRREITEDELAESLERADKQIEAGNYYTLKEVRQILEQDFDFGS